MDTHFHDFEAASVAIVGLAGRFPAASSAAELWALLQGGREATQWLTEDELRAAGVSEADLQDPDYVRASLVLPKMEMFDAEFFGFSKRDASILDPQHRHFLECAWEALEDAGHPPESFDGAIGVFGGCGMQAYLPYNLLTNPKLVKSVGLFLLRHTGNDKDFLTSRLSYLLGLTGPSITIQTACSTSLVAVHVAAQSLLSGECDMALAGGVSIELPHRRGYHYAEGEILSPDGHCRAFDDNAKGTIFGSGAAIVVLRRLEDAVKDRDNIYAVIRGSAVNNDGAAKAGYLAPSVDGQARAAVEALAVAGVDAASVSYIEAHGTGTPVGDPIEVAALTQAYGSGGQGFCGIGSLKTNIGHLDTAAGAASLIKVALALRHGLIPPSLNFSQPNSRFDMAKTPFRVVDRATPWTREGASGRSGPRRAAVNSLGVGGTNAHVILEEAPAIGSASAQAGWQIVTLSARSAASLEGIKAKWRDFLAQPPAGFTLADAAYTTQVGRKSFEHRCAIVAPDVAGLRAALAAQNHARCVTGKALAKAPGVVLMFPGGGAQYPGVGRELLSQPAFRQAVEECFSVMPAAAPADLRAVMFESAANDAAAANALERPTPALLSLFILEYALAKLWQSWGVTPSAVIGHSAGEYAAACFAGVMSVADALSVVLLRGQLFEAVPPGSMVSVDLPEAELRAVMSGLTLDIAAVNAPDLCIASGPLQAMAELETRLTAQGLESRRLRINVAAHSQLLDGVLPAFREGVSRIRLHAPTIPFVSNLTGNWADAQLLTDPDYWVRHLRSPVRFSEGLRKVFELPDTLLVEAGPGQGLCALARHNSAGQPRTILPSTCKAQEPGADLAQMLTTAGALWTRGAVPKWEALRGTPQARRISLPTYAFDHQRHWIEAGALPQDLPAPRLEAATPALPAIRRLASYDDWFLAPQWHLAPLHAATPRSGLHWLVFDNGSKLSADLVLQAQAQGGHVTRVRRGQTFARLADGSFTLVPADAAHYRSLLEMLEQAARLPDCIVYLWALDTPAGSQNQPERLAGQTLAFDSLVYVAQALQALALDQPMHLTVLSAASQSVSGEALPHPERALALGPCRVIPRELPNVSIRLIDLDGIDNAGAGVGVSAPPEALVRALLAECQSADPCDLVAYRAGQRWSLQLANAHAKAGAAPPAGRQPCLRSGGVYLITGGLGDIALDLATFLASTQQARLALVSRRRLPPTASWRALAASGDGSPEAQIVRRLLACEDAGGQILALSADAADRTAMTQAISACRAHFGNIHGVFHAAGALDDGPIATKSADSLQRVLNPKALGAQLLHELLPPGELDVFAMFSSTSVYTGPPGQVDYVAANAFMDALAASRPDGLSLHWGIWGDQGMAARAYGQAPAAYGLQTALHPLLGVQVGSEQGAAFEATYLPKALWVLQEHSVAGRLVLPGTAYIEIARAAMVLLHPGTAIEINALSFEAAMVFEGPAARSVRVELRRSGEAYEFLVRSRATPEQPWLEHARARVSVFLGSLAAAAPPTGGAWRSGEIPQAQRIAFGARWRNIARMQLAERSAIAEMELAEPFAGDLATYAAHPALLDMAATFGLHLIDESERRQHLFVPLSIERIRLVAPLPRHSTSRVALRGLMQNRFATFDVSLHATDGSPIASLEGVCLRGVAPEQVLQPAQGGAEREPTLIEAMLSCGIRAEDAPTLFARIFASRHRELVVSSISLADLQRAKIPALPKAPARRAQGGGAALGEEGSALNPVEAGIADVWRELLGVDEVSRDDDFFALGGHSLAAVRLFARIRKQFAVDLPLAILFEAPTLSSLAAIVAQRGGIATGTVTLTTPQIADQPQKLSSNVIALTERAWSALVAICQGRPDRRPLFCVHGAGGNVLNFKVISDRLGPALPLYGLQAQGVDGRLPVLSSIEAMAAQYVEAIRSVDPHGPYRLVGYSGGGLIALEMAQQLKRAGAQIALLAMIDTLSPSAAGRTPPFLKKLWLIRHWSVKFAMERPERRRRGKLMETNYALALEKLARGEPLPPELVEFHLFRNFVAAQHRYVPAPYAGSLVLLRALDADTEYLAAGSKLGWEQHITGKIRVTAIAGSHFSMMAEPGVSQLIKALEKELALLDAHPESPHSKAA
jgi:acyl transferase domain-containing protein/thioesterase domain-containing protein/acyl carrier protein